MPCGLAICPAWHSASYFTLRPPTQFVVPHTFILFQMVSTFPDASFAWNVLHAYSIWPTPREAWLSAEWSGTLLPAHCASHLSTQSGSCSPLHVQGLTTVGAKEVLSTWGRRERENAHIGKVTIVCILWVPQRIPLSSGDSEYSANSLTAGTHPLLFL